MNVILVVRSHYKALEVCKLVNLKGWFVNILQMREFFDDIVHIRVILGFGKFTLETVLWLGRLALGAQATVVRSPR